MSTTNLRMNWTAVRCSNDLLGEREGHCSAAISFSSCRLIPGTSDSSSQLLVVIGGFREGEIPAEVIVAPLHEELCWTVAASNESVFAKDGASLTLVQRSSDLKVDFGDETDGCGRQFCGDQYLLMFGGMSGDARKTNDAFLIGVIMNSNSDENAAVSIELAWREVCLLGEVPTPRFRHAVATSTTSLFIFGGATDVNDESSDLFEVNLITFVSRRVNDLSGHALPLRPRFLSSLVYMPKNCTLVLYGGAFYQNGQQKSCSDLAVIDTTSWELILIDPANKNSEHGYRIACASTPIHDFLPRTNGHVGRCIKLFAKNGEHDEIAVFSGGKDFDEGCDDVVVVALEGGGVGEPSVKKASARCVRAADDVRTGSSPHWRYTASTVDSAICGGLLWVIAGQCRHPDNVEVFVLHVSA